MSTSVKDLFGPEKKTSKINDDSVPLIQSSGRADDSVLPSYTAWLRQELEAVYASKRQIEAVLQQNNAQIKEMTAENADLQAQITLFKKEAAKAMSEAQGATHRLTTAQSEFQKAREQLLAERTLMKNGGRELSLALKQEREKGQRLATEHGWMTRVLAESKEYQQAQEIRLEQANEKTENSFKELKSLRIKLDLAQEDLVQTHTALEKAKVAATVAAAKSQSDACELDQRQQEIDELNRERQKLEARLRHERKERDIATTELEKAKEFQRAQEIALEQANEKIDLAASEARTLKLKLEQQQREVEEVKKERQKWQARIREENDERLRVAAELEKTKVLQRAQETRLEFVGEKTEQSNAEVRELKFKLDQRKQEADSLKKEIEKLQKSYPIRDLIQNKNQEIERIRLAVERISPDSTGIEDLKTVLALMISQRDRLGELLPPQ